MVECAPIGKAPPELEPGGYWFNGRRVKYDYGRVLARLGKVTDAALAAEIGAPRGYVFRLRRRLGIPKCDKAAAALPWLGKVPDRELARRCGVDARTIKRRREERGIKPASLARHRADQLLRSYVEALKGTA